MCDHANREEAMVTVVRDKDDGTPLVWCDPCLVDLVTALNTNGLRTVASCCGHGIQDGSIVLADGRELVIRPFDERSHTTRMEFVGWQHRTDPWRINDERTSPDQPEVWRQRPLRS